MWQKAARLLSACGVALLLHACSAVPSRVVDPAAEQAYQQRHHELQALQYWRLSGKLAASDGKDGGSGNFTWQNSGAQTSMSFRGAMGKGAWELESRDGQAALRFADGREYFASTIAQLVMTHMRAKVPVDALSWWVLGLARPGGWAERELDAEGRITRLVQSDWEVDFSGYRSEQEQWLPGKLVARNQQNTVKLVISDWDLAVEAPALD